MAKLLWDQTGAKTYETGVNQCALYVQDPSDGSYPLGVPWSGVTGITESPTGAETTAMYADNIKYLNLLSVEEFEASLTAYTYPDEFAACDGQAELAAGSGAVVGQQTRSPFGLSYKTALGNDVAGNSYGYKIHIIYGALASPSEKSYETINDSPDAIEFSWDLTTTPVAIANLEPSSHIVIDSLTATTTGLAALEDAIWGGAGVAYLPLPDEVATLLATV